jgi:hypothetical protein
MKKILFVLMVLCLAGSVLAQVPQAGNYVKVSSGTASTDSLSTINYRVKHLVTLIVTLPIATDTIIVKQGTTTMATILVPTTASNPFYIPLDCKIDSNIVTVQRKKTSHVVTVWRSNY